MTNAEQVARYHEWTVGDRLRAARESVERDKNRFAEKIGVSPDTIRNYERGTYRPKPVVLSAWCLATGFDKEWILTGHIPDDPNEGDVSTPVTLRELPGNRLLFLPNSLLKQIA